MSGIMLLMAFMSITSIGDRIFEFRGFIVKGLMFYHGLTDPIIKIVRNLDLFYFDREVMDSVTYVCMGIGAIWKASSSKTSRFNRRHEEFSKHDIGLGLFPFFFASLAPIITFFSITLVTIFSLSAVDYFVSMSWPYYFFIGFSLLILFTSWHFWDDKQYIKKLILCFFGPIVLVAIVASISEGVSRSIQ